MKGAEINQNTMWELFMLLNEVDACVRVREWGGARL